MIGSKCKKSNPSIGMPLMKSGQIISYATGDDGDIQAGRAVDYFTLETANPFGNTNRFTDIFGTQFYPDDIVLDWSTFSGGKVLGYYRRNFESNGVDMWNWSDCIALFSNVAIASFIGWRMARLNEVMSIINYTYLDLIDYFPFSFTGNFFYSIWVSTAKNQDTCIYLSPRSPNALINYHGSRSTGGAHAIAVRDFTVIGTQII